jgi:hypothetical protein
MKVSLKVILTFIVSFIAMFTINLSENSNSEYNTGLFVIIVFISGLAGIITIWSNKSGNPLAKTNN